ncbi:CheR family methyltransferase [Acidisoma sp. L85]|uniref:CheR family methyltransferase n=1 Tax=Acidisoma sp. L85 TaxID=1641850 RepID=UPI0020B1220B|nr:CheR family methyltransferase [Acidisoma sp. L85]
MLDALPGQSGMGFIVIQHLDPTHESLMVELLSAHTPMPVLQATSGMIIERDHVYVIPPGRYLSVAQGVLQLSRPVAPRGARLPFDFLLRSLAEEFGSRAISVILSGTGADGSLGSQTIRLRGGHTIAQQPDEAAYDGMPRSAIAAGVVDVVLPIIDIPAALIQYAGQRSLRIIAEGVTPVRLPRDCVNEIIELIRARTVYDFTLYKPGTLKRRIERRMAMASIPAADMGRYLATLGNDTAEVDLLAMDLLINVTSFFRDRKVFEVLSERIVPELVRAHADNQPIRIWIVGCSTGQETYSLAMLFHEQVAAAKLDMRLQFFASDVDPEAIATAREGLYPAAIEAEVSPARLVRFFSKEDHGYRVSAELRGMVVFTVQNVLADPPFSRLDLISCRNLLIYLSPEAQAKVISVVQFALRENGVLLLGTSETIEEADNRFSVISKPERLYRRVGRDFPMDAAYASSVSEAGRFHPRPGPGPKLARQVSLADFGRRLVLEKYAPASILINYKHDCLFSVGPTDRYLRATPEEPTQDLFAMARPEIRSKLKSAVDRAIREKTRVIEAGGRGKGNDGSTSFNIDVQPVTNAGEEFLLVSFVSGPSPEESRRGVPSPHMSASTVDDQQELESTKAELQTALRDLEIMVEEHKAINEEALSANEEYQSTNEELLASKEELQSLNEELTALNHQLQEALSRQRVTSDDLQNVLYSTDVATIFLDANLKIRFFTPATRALFSVIPSDIGRPLADLASLAPEASITIDAQTVLTSETLVEREIEGEGGTWYRRRISPYRAHDAKVEGVVITFTDITKRIYAGRELEAAKQQAELANVTKSRFLAAASHDLRQPLQTLTLLQGLLAQSIEGEKAQTLVARLDETLAAMSGMLNTLLDINQIDAGTVCPEIVTFPINDLLTRLRDEFSYHAQARGLSLSVVSCGLAVESDPHLLEQIIRNLLSNAIKYTKHGKVLLGCRRHATGLTVEVWDTGIGVSPGELQSIFQEYYQVDNAARERSRGLGLGLSIVKRLADLLGGPIRVHSSPGRGSVFKLDVAFPARELAATPVRHGEIGAKERAAVRQLSGSVLVVEDDTEVRELLALVLREQGHHPTTASDGVFALDLVTRQLSKPDLLISDYNLPGGMNGLEVIRRLRDVIGREIPAIVLTGDTSSETSNSVASQRSVQLNKPVRTDELTKVIQHLLRASPISPAAPLMRAAGKLAQRVSPIVFVVDDDSHVRDAIREVLEEDGRIAEAFASGEEFLATYRPGREACLLVDASLPEMSGLELLRHLRRGGDEMPAIMITGNGDVPMAVEAMKAGASDFIEKPIGPKELLASVARALEEAGDSHKLIASRAAAASQVAGLTPRQRQIMALVLAGHPSKNIASDLGISQRTVENHRASIMEKTGATSLPALARLALAAARTKQPGFGDGSEQEATITCLPIAK